MDRSLWKSFIMGDKAPDWPCPTCNKGNLKIQPDTFVKNETVRSRDHSHEAWEPEWIHYVFSCLLECNNSACKETVSCSGDGTVDYFFVRDDERDEVYEDYFDRFEPKYFEPHLNLIRIPDECPKPVEEALKESFRLFFASPGSALNSIRVAIEELLTSLKIKRFRKVGGSLRMVSLHERIMSLPKKYASEQDVLLAAKWLGNAGSHSGTAVTTDDVMDAYDLVEHALSELYDQRTKKLLAKARRVNKRKGPEKRKKSGPYVS